MLASKRFSDELERIIRLFVLSQLLALGQLDFFSRRFFVGNLS
jgi:hypothetical protein